MNRRRLSAFSLVILISASVNAFAGTPPPQTPFDAITWKATMKKKPSTGLTMGSLHVRFERTTLDDVRRAVSIGDISHQGDAGESIYWLCYTNANPRRVERIWIVAHGEMGGSEHRITNISAQLLPNESATTDCPAVPGKMKPLSLSSNLWLNTSAGDARTSLGPASHQKGPWLSFNYQGKVPGNCQPDGFDLMNWLAFRTAQGRIVAISAGQVTSC